MSAPIAPRLLKPQEAADYLALPLATLKRLGIGRRQLGPHVRYDRYVIDAYLDGESVEAPNAIGTLDEAEAALARFTQRQSNAPGRS